MTTWQIILGVLLIISSIAIIIVVLLQEGRQAGLSGAIAGGGGGDTFLGKNKGRTTQAKLVRLTKFIAISFFVLVLLATLLITFL